MASDGMPLDDLRQVFAPDVALRASERAVLASLIMHRNNGNGRCNPSLPRLAATTGMSVYGVRRIVRRLEAAGALHTDHHPFKPSCYRLDLEALPRTEGADRTDVAPRTESAPTPHPRVTNPAPRVRRTAKELRRELLTDVRSTKKPSKRTAAKDDELLSSDGQRVVRYLDERLRASDGAGLGVGSGSAWGACVRQSKAALRDGCRVEDLEAAIAWGLSDDYWRLKIRAHRGKLLRDVWSAWVESRSSNGKGKHSAGRSRRREFPGEPSFSAAADAWGGGD